MNFSRAPLLLILLLSSTRLAAGPYHDLAEVYLRSFDQLEAQPAGAANQLPAGLNNEHDKMAVALGVLDKSSTSIEKSLIAPQTWRDLELFCGEGLDAQRYFLSKIDRTKTRFGRATLAHKLAYPSLQPAGYPARMLLADHELFTLLDDELSRMAKDEASMLSLFVERDEMSKAFTDKVFFTNKYLTRFNQNPYVLEVLIRLKNCGNALSVSSYFLAKFFGSWYLGGWMRAGAELELQQPDSMSEALHIMFRSFKEAIGPSLKDTFTFGDMRKLFEVYRYGLDSYKPMGMTFPVAVTAQQKEKIDNFKKIYLGLSTYFEVLALIKGYGWAKAGIDNHLEMQKVLSYLQENLISVASYLASLKAILKLTALNEELRASLTTFEPAQAMLTKNFDATNAKIQKAIELLSTKTFKGKPSFFSLIGRVLAAHTILDEVKDELVPLFAFAGEVDAWMSVARLYKEHSGSHAAYSFVDFVVSDKPYLKLDGFWNPAIDPQVVVTNNVEIGGTSAQNAVITGPNGGGKSTILAALALSIIMAHSFGIAPATTAVMTPFEHVNTYLNIIDDKLAGRSLFQMQAIRAQELVDSITKLGRNQFVFTIIDELFNGTNHVEGEAAAYSVTKSLIAHPHSMFLIATHFPRLTKLEEAAPAQCYNYKVSVNKDEQGKLVYPFLFERGITSQNIALDILKEKGLSMQVLDEAYELINGRHSDTKSGDSSAL